MICPNCGKIVPDGVSCTCTIPTGGPYSSNPAVNLIKTIGASQTFLAAIILTGAAALLSLIGSFFGTRDMTDILNQYFSGSTDMYGSGYVISASVVSNITRVFSALISFAVQALVIGALIHFHVSCKNVSTGGVNAGGLSVLKVIVTINIVLGCVVLIIVFLGLLAGIFSYSSSEYFYGYSISVIMLLTFAILIVAGAFLIPYAISLVRTIGNIRATCRTGERFGDVSQYLIVMSYIIAVINILYAFSLVGDNVGSAMNSLCSGVALILFAQMLSRYRREILRIYNPVPMYSMPYHPGAQVPSGQYPYPPQQGGQWTPPPQGSAQQFYPANQPLTPPVLPRQEPPQGQPDGFGAPENQGQWGASPGSPTSGGQILQEETTDAPVQQPDQVSSHENKEV